MLRKCANTSVGRLCMVVLSKLMQQEYYFFLLQIKTPQGAAMLICSSPMKIRKRFAHCVMYTSAIHAGFVHDIIDTLRLPVPNTKWQLPWPYFGDFWLSVKKKTPPLLPKTTTTKHTHKKTPDHKMTELYALFKLQKNPFLLIRPVMLPCLESPLSKILHLILLTSF